MSVIPWKELVSPAHNPALPRSLAGLWALLTQVPPATMQHPCPGTPYPTLSSRPLICPFWFSSIVLMASKGRYTSRGPWTRVLEKLGAHKGLKLKGKDSCIDPESGCPGLLLRPEHFPPNLV